MKKFESETVSLTIDDDILFVVYTKPYTIDLESAKRDVNYRIAFQEGKSYYVITDIANLKTASKKAREFLSNPEGGLKGIIAGAFVSNSIFSYTILNLFLKINKPVIPSRFFLNQEDAIKWISKLKKETEK